ncbi:MULTISPECIES: hypothetical protein [unclassified Thiomonas]|jgi:hypothetical protein|uniref:hypothetical protein n=1 Tax=unclassified Thiomonas TaxID=2625466 RepID=UPI0004DBA31F|nr:MULTISPECIES: hypothetical protein [unclassified Thiomonas]CQR41335.1 conserved hypothetical protein [Thiomonas sp. CB3]CDW96475.1 conserved hypothetical protein [Thiomonas sp. CB2]VDY06168.1 conserved protein of unknown function [Thiomonas sp. Bio17B3]VDY06174.1 conserved protein of unknown function [Thiomonas sp. Bio17B3]VDY08509.1 conserved protein of unknown function [Thiomonas sp. Sup16B3]
MALVKTYFDEGTFLEPCAMAAFKAEGTPLAGAALLVPLPGHHLMRLQNATLSAALKLTSGHDDSTFRIAVLVLQTGPLQIVCAVPMVTTAARAWLIDGVERYGLMRLVLQHSDRPLFSVSTCRLPVTDTRGAAWQNFKDQLLSGSMQVGAGEELEMLDDLMKSIEEVAPNLVPGVKKFERRVFVCWPDEGKQAAIAPENPEDYGYVF